MPHLVLALALGILGVILICVGLLWAGLVVVTSTVQPDDYGTVAQPDDPGRPWDQSMRQTGWHPEARGHRFEGHNPDALPALPFPTTRPGHPGHVGMGAMIFDLDEIRESDEAVNTWEREEASHQVRASRYEGFEPAGPRGIDWEGGQTAAEYAVVLAVITLGAIIAMTALSGAISDALASMTGQL